MLEVEALVLSVDGTGDPAPNWSPQVAIGAHMSDPISVSRRLVAVFAADVEVCVPKTKSERIDDEVHPR